MKGVRVANYRGSVSKEELPEHWIARANEVLELLTDGHNTRLTQAETPLWFFSGEITHNGILILESVEGRRSQSACFDTVLMRGDYILDKMSSIARDHYERVLLYLQMRGLQGSSNHTVQWRGNGNWIEGERKLVGFAYDQVRCSDNHIRYITVPGKLLLAGSHIRLEVK